MKKFKGYVENSIIGVVNGSVVMMDRTTKGIYIVRKTPDLPTMSPIIAPFQFVDTNINFINNENQ